MKRTFLWLSLLVVLGSFISTDKTQILLKKWVLVEFITPRLERNFKLRGITQERRTTVMKKLVKDSFVHFYENGTYETSILGSETERMHWKLSENDSILLVRKSLDFEPKPIELEELNKNKLIMVLPDIEGEYTRMIFVPEDNN
jgi:hypothetical protein